MGAYQMWWKERRFKQAIVAYPKWTNYWQIFKPKTATVYAQICYLVVAAVIFCRQSFEKSQNTFCPFQILMNCSSETFRYLYLEPATADRSRRVGSELQRLKTTPWAAIIETRHRFEATQDSLYKEEERLSHQRGRGCGTRWWVGCMPVEVGLFL